MLACPAGSDQQCHSDMRTIWVVPHSSQEQIFQSRLSLYVMNSTVRICVFSPKQLWLKRCFAEKELAPEEQGWT